MKSYYLQFTNDEGYSYFLIKTHYFRAMPGTANTHWLNSLGIWFGLLLGDDPWKLRLFSVLAWPVYGYAAFKLSNKLNNKLAGLALLSALVLNPYLLDFFSVARGYGMMIAFSMMSLYHAYCLVKEQNWSIGNWQLPFLWASFALLANFSSFYNFLALGLLFLLQHAINGNIRPVFNIPFKRWVFFCAGTVAFTISSLLFIKFYSGDLEFGHQSNLIESIIGSVVNASLYGSASLETIRLISYGLVLFISAGAIQVIVNLVKLRKIIANDLFTCLIAIFLLLNIVFHLLLNTPYLSERTALIIYPMMVLTLLFQWDELLAQRPGLNLLGNAFSILLISGFLLMASTKSELHYHYDWKFNAEVKEVYEYFHRKKAKKVYMDPVYMNIYRNYYSHAYPQLFSFEISTISQLESRHLLPLVIEKMKGCEYAAFFPPVDTSGIRNSGYQFTVQEKLPVTNCILMRLGNVQ
ncbi:hypothetical protein [Flavihumibacter profundi]|uniref:hypothetical protein n=1 Tax=Flavihumibacter profundi TaxID=2716883 RepID=UPI001CC3A2D4|nr:hypothetical protein [Flavihumibacter profundi]MBZ5858753.1 hypothetical protein [Flavihumibacter profundi]